MRMRLSLLAVLASAALAAALAIGGASSPASPPPCGHKPTGVTVGRVTVIASSQVWRNKEQLTTAPRHLRSSDTLCTDMNGQFDMHLWKTKASDCTVRSVPGSNARLVLYPKGEPKTIAHFYGGLNVCTTSKEAISVDFTIGPPGPSMTRVRTSDPTFAVTYDGDTATVKVQTGVIAVLDPHGQKPALLVGPGEQVAVHKGVIPLTKQPVSFTPEENAALGRIRPFVPTYDFGPPSPAGSPTLARMTKRGKLHVGVESGISGPMNAFATKFLDFLARSWKVNLTTTTINAGSAPKLLESGSIDLAVAVSAPASGPIVVPFAVDPKKTAWTLVPPDDPVYATALRRFLTNAIQAGDYADAYRAAFAQNPPYYTLRKLVIKP
jgi:hypothetical protein